MSGAPLVLIWAFAPAGVYHHCHFHRIGTALAALKGCRMTYFDWTGVKECCGKRSKPPVLHYCSRTLPIVRQSWNEPEASSMIRTHGLPNDPCTTSAFYQRSLRWSHQQRSQQSTIHCAPVSQRLAHSLYQPGGTPACNFRDQNPATKINVLVVQLAGKHNCMYILKKISN